MSSREEDKEVNRQRKSANLMCELSPLLPYFETPTITNIHVYGDGRVQIEDFKSGTSDVGITLSNDQRRRIISNLADMQEIAINTFSDPTLECIIPQYNIRFTAILPPWVKAPQMTFRRPAEQVYTLEQYREDGRITETLYNILIERIKARNNIVISGSTGSGKTTFTNACIEKMREFTPDERFYIVEDTPELQCMARDAIPLYIRKDQSRRAIQLSLRFTPKRIIFGEIRSGDILVELLEAWNTGHSGNITTIHADSAASTIPRLEGLMRQVIMGTLPDISDTIDLIVHLTYKRDFGPVVDEIVTTKELKHSQVAGECQSKTPQKGWFGKERRKTLRE